MKQHVVSVLALLSTGLLFQATPADAEGWDFAGYVAAETRLFINDPAYSNQRDDRVSPSLVIEPELVYESNNRQYRFTLVPFARWDAHDEERQHADLREANLLYIKDNLDVLAGIGKVFWGVTESRHLVDIINQTDSVEDIDGEDKLGQPMLRLNVINDWGTVSAFVLPGFRERTFPAHDARLRGALVIDTDNPVYESSDGQSHIDYAVRYAHTLGQWDLGLSYFDGTSREPRLIPTIKNSQILLVPHYDQINQLGLDAQYTGEATLWKLELISRHGQGRRFVAGVGGLEYTLYGVLNSKADLGLIFEYQYDDRNPSEAPATAADDDFFLGTRLTLNDISDTTFLAGVIIDRHTHSTFYSVEAAYRISNNWKIELEGRFTGGVDENDILYGIRDDDFITLRLAYFI